eukprot:CAMPEP_0178402920 /NCGR_PEP_ID=MMETSP0689_2-20121128/17101_1 /TAXON_ID=160604 /ORGANISM="Amphidinium massartii, Strain CS-259" /LENGTH=419 /DNA_ID=CAMNT_0020023857 /DNA_START=101 /DNA_END=1360 /DNA_ORIENTATION=+
MAVLRTYVFLLALALAAPNAAATAATDSTTAAADSTTTAAADSTTTGAADSTTTGLAESTTTGLAESTTTGLAESTTTGLGESTTTGAFESTGSGILSTTAEDENATTTGGNVSTTEDCGGYDEGCYVSECGGALVADEWCQKNKGRCEAPGQSCNGVWCSAGIGSCSSSTASATVTSATVTLTAPTTPTTTLLNTDCEVNVIGFVLVLVDVDSSSPSFEATLIAAIAAALGTSEDCVNLGSGASTFRRRLTGSTVSQPGTGGVAPGTTATQVQTALNSPSFTSSVCGTVGGPSCSVTAAAATTTTTTTTTTSEMPWGLPWWAWFLICCGILLLCALCFLPICGAPLAMGGKKKSKASATTTETIYEVVDEPDTVPLTGAAVPMATSVIPMSSSNAVPMATAAYPMATAAPMATAYPYA